MPVPFGATWGTLCERCEELPDDATLITPLASRRFRITDVQEPRIIIEDTDTGDAQPLDGEQFEALAEHTHEAVDGYELDRLPPKAEPYAAVLDAAVVTTSAPENPHDALENLLEGFRDARNETIRVIGAVASPVMAPAIERMLEASDRMEVVIDRGCYRD